MISWRALAAQRVRFLIVVAALPLLLQFLWVSHALLSNFGVSAPLYALVGFSPQLLALGALWLCLSSAAALEAYVIERLEPKRRHWRPSLVLGVGFFMAFSLLALVFELFFVLASLYPLRFYSVDFSWVSLGLFFIGAFELERSIHAKQVIDASPRLLMFVSGYYLLLSFSNGVGAALCVLSALAALSALIKTRAQLLFVQRVAQSEAPAYQLAPNQPDIEGLPYLAYYPSVVYDGILFRRERDTADPFRSQTRTTPHCLFPLQPEALVTSLEHTAAWLSGLLALASAGVIFFLLVLG